MPKGGARYRSGPPPTPNAIKHLEGTYRPERDRSGGREPKPKADAPRRPIEITGRAKREWDLIIPELRAMGVLATCDRVALAGYATSAGRFFDLTAELTRMGEWGFTDDGGVEINRLAVRRDKAEQSMLRFLMEFGLSPASRSRVIAKAEKDGDADDPGEAYFNRPRLRLVP